MVVIVAFHAMVGLWLFALGAVVGSFLNVCIYRIPWQKSVIWPGSHCPRCHHAIVARDNIPILSWLALRGECRHCGLPIAPRYALVEALVGLLFVATYLTDVVFADTYSRDLIPYYRAAYHLGLIVLLVVATFIDYDLQIIPDEVTVPGMVVGIVVGALIPQVRPEPSTATTMLGGLAVGVVGWLVGGGLTWSFRVVFSKALGREAMGFGDVTLMAMIGAFLGWRAAILTFFVAPFFGLAHAAWKVLRYLQKRLRGLQTSGADREMPFGPYLSMAAVALLLCWPWYWKIWGENFFRSIGQVVRFLVSGEV